MIAIALLALALAGQSSVGVQQAAEGVTTTTRAPAAAIVDTGKPVKADTLRDQRKAAKLYLRGVKLLEQRKPELAWAALKEAAQLEPENTTYATAAELARQSAVTQLVQQATTARIKFVGSQGNATEGKSAEAATMLKHALELDPRSPSALEHLNQLSEEEASHVVGQTAAEALGPTGQGGSAMVASGPIVLEPTQGRHSFHLRNVQKQVVQEVFKAYGIDASVHESVLSKPVRLDVDEASFEEAVHVLGMVTQTFYEPLDPRRVVVARDTRENRTLFQRQSLETIYLPGLTDKELTDVSNMAHNVFDAQQAVVEPTRGTLTIRAPAKTLTAFNQTVNDLIDGRNQVDLEVKVIQLAHISDKETGTTFFQQTGVYNVYSEIATVLSQNQSLVQQVISSGLVPNANTLTNQVEILAILVASGQLTGTPFNQGFLPFGGGLTQSIVSPGPATLNFSLNSSDTRTLDDVHLRLSDDEPGTIKTGERYPIETSSYSALALTAASSTGTNTQTVPQIQYEDLGLTMKATPKVMRSNDVALTIDLKIQALGGTSLNGIPILDNRQIAGVVTLQAGETAVMLGNLSRQESRALSGLPGVSDVPGLQDISDVARNRNVARLLILVTPRIVRRSMQSGHGPLLKVDKGIAH